MPKPINHPVFGRMIPDQWNLGLMFFREFRFLSPFRPADPDEALRQLDPAHRRQVVKWKEQPAKLAKICRHSDVHAALQSLGVYEVSVAMDGRDEPSAEQSAAYEFFEQNEETVCRNLCDALLRYYPVARAEDEHWFDNADCPQIGTLDELTPLIRFDGFSVARTHCEGLSVLSFGWDPDWDPEHGLTTSVWRDQVVAIGVGVEEMFHMADFAVWNPARMTPQERQSFEQLRKGVVVPED
jgi:hypothetical protein